MREYKLNKNKKETSAPTDAVINKHKSFKDLRLQYNEVVKRPKEPLYKNKRLFMLILLIGLTAWLVYDAMEKEEHQSGSNNIESTE